MSATPAYEAIEEQLDLLNFYSDPHAAVWMIKSVHEAAKNPPLGGRPRVLDEEGVAKTARDMARAAAEMLTIANPYFVTREIHAIINSGLPSFPDDSVLEERHLPTPAGFILLEDEVPLPYSLHNYEQPLKAFGWHRLSDRGMDVLFFGPSREEGRPRREDFKMQLQTIYRVPFGEPLNSTVGWSVAAQLGIETPEEERRMNDRVRICARWAASLLHFMVQRIAALELRPAPRPTRRRFEREARRETPLIRTIVLRAREAKAHYAEETEGGKWTVRSIRRAHWHHVWCKGGSKMCLSNGEHREARLELRWIEATICGPEGAPLRRPVDLYAVSR